MVPWRALWATVWANSVSRERAETTDERVHGNLVDSLISPRRQCPDCLVAGALVTRIFASAQVAASGSAPAAFSKSSCSHALGGPGYSTRLILAGPLSVPLFQGPAGFYTNSQAKRVKCPTRKNAISLSPREGFGRKSYFSKCSLFCPPTIIVFFEVLSDPTFPTNSSPRRLPLLQLSTPFQES